MDMIRPKTYKDIIRFQNCVALKKHVTSMSDELFCEIYDFIKNPENTVSVSGGTLTFIADDVDLTEVSAENIKDCYKSVPCTLLSGYISVNLSSSSIRILGPFNSSGRSGRAGSTGSTTSGCSSCSGCSGCGGGGCGGNNNNNNNA